MHVVTFNAIETDRTVTLKKLYPIIQIITGTLLVILVVNDFVELLFEFLFDVEKLKVPIEWSNGGWKAKYWMFDNPDGWSLRVWNLWQGAIMISGFILIFTGLFRYLPRWTHLGIVGGLLISAVFVLLFPSVAYLVEQTPKDFMWYQIIAGLILLPAALKNQNIKLIQTVGLYIATFIMAIFLIVTLATSIVTLIYGILPIIGVSFLLLTKKQFAS